MAVSEKQVFWGKRRAFTMIEVSVALIILGVIAATVLVIINRAVDTVVVWQTKMQAFEIIRENMEQILAKSSASNMLEYGTSETNPDITWETTVESFYEPITNKMWVRAVCSAEFPDPNGEPQKIELTQWLTGLSEKQIMQILEQQRQEKEYQQAMGGYLGKKSSDLQQQSEKLFQQTEQLQQQAEQLQQQAKQLQQSGQSQQQVEKLLQQAEQIQQQAEQTQQQAEQAQQQAEQTQQSQQGTEAQNWKEVESLIGPPPAGYDHWGQVPEDQFWKAMIATFKKKK